MIDNQLNNNNIRQSIRSILNKKIIFIIENDLKEFHLDDNIKTLLKESMCVCTNLVINNII